MAEPRAFLIDRWLVEPRAYRVSRDGVTNELTPRLVALLQTLAARPGEVISREQLLEAVWPDSYVGEESLTQAVSGLRRVLGDSSRSPRVIRTVRNVGYQLIAPVEAVSGAPPPRVSLADAPAQGATAAVIPSERSVSAEAPPRPVGTRLVGFISTRSLAAIAGCAVVLVLVAMSVRASRQPVAAVPIPRPLTTYPGFEFDPAISPDGTTLAFGWSDVDGNVDLYLRRLDAETPMRLTSQPGPGFDGSPTWSPDGATLAFIRSEGDRCTVFMKPLPSGDEHRFAGCNEHFERALAWSPDGEHLAIADRENSQRPVRIYLLSTRTRRARPLTAPPAGLYGDLFPAFSPDGRHLAFVRGQVEGPLARTASPVIGDIHVADIATGAVRRLTFDAHEIPGLAWTADGQQIVFSSNRGGGRFALWQIDVGGGEARSLLQMEGVLRNPNVSPAGTALQITRDETDIWRLQLDPATGRAVGEPSRFLSSTRPDLAPAYSPDGDSIAFVSMRSGSPEIWIADGDGANPVRRTWFEGSHVGAPSWSPDSRFVVFESYLSGNAEIYTLPRADGRPRRITDNPAPDLAPSYTADGQALLFGSTRSGTWQIWRIPLGDGEPVRVTRDGGLAARELRLGDEQALYFVHADAGGLRRLTADGRDEIVSDRVRLGAKDWGSWAVLGDSVYFLDHHDPWRAAYRRYDIGDGTVETLLEVEHDATWSRPGLTVSPDGRWLLFTRLTDVEGDILLIDDQVAS